MAAFTTRLEFRETVRLSFVLQHLRNSNFMWLRVWLPIKERGVFDETIISSFMKSMSCSYLHQCMAHLRVLKHYDRCWNSGHRCRPISMLPCVVLGQHVSRYRLIIQGSFLSVLMRSYQIWTSQMFDSGLTNHQWSVSYITMVGWTTEIARNYKTKLIKIKVIQMCQDICGIN
jgi:hypothetical protein